MGLLQKQTNQTNFHIWCIKATIRSIFCTHWTSRMIISMFLQCRCSCDTAGCNSILEDFAVLLYWFLTLRQEHRLILKSTSMEKKNPTLTHIFSSVQTINHGNKCTVLGEQMPGDISIWKLCLTEHHSLRLFHMVTDDQCQVDWTPWQTQSWVIMSYGASVNARSI